MCRKIFLSSVVSLLFPSLLLAQAEVSSVYEIAFDSAISNLNKHQLAIYTGKEYYSYFIKPETKYAVTSVTVAASRVGEHPFYISDDFRLETVEFEGNVYKSISLAYDICRSEVVVLNPNQKAIVLPAGKVQKFSYAGHTFRSLTTVNGLEADFYEILYWTDSTSLVVKRRKDQNELWHTISDYYIILNNQAYAVSLVTMKSVGVKATLLEIFKDQKEAVHSHIRQNRLKFSKKKKEQSLIKVVEYYASLKTN